MGSALFLYQDDNFTEVWDCDCFECGPSLVSGGRVASWLVCSPLDSVDWV